jgi:hypothetical protein
MLWHELCLMPGRRGFGASARSSHEDSGKSRVWFANGAGRSAGAAFGDHHGGRMEPKSMWGLELPCYGMRVWVRNPTVVAGVS